MEAVQLDADMADALEFIQHAKQQLPRASYVSLLRALNAYRLGRNTLGEVNADVASLIGHDDDLFSWYQTFVPPQLRCTMAAS